MIMIIIIMASGQFDLFSCVCVVLLVCCLISCLLDICFVCCFGQRPVQWGTEVPLRRSAATHGARAVSRRARKFYIFLRLFSCLVSMLRFVVCFCSLLTRVNRPVGSAQPWMHHAGGLFQHAC